MNPPRLRQPAAAQVMLGKTLDLHALVWGTGPWPDPVWASSDPAVATVAAVVSSPQNATVTPVALGVTVVSATVAGEVQRFTVDVVPFRPQAVELAVGPPAGYPLPWPA